MLTKTHFLFHSCQESSRKKRVLLPLGFGPQPHRYTTAASLRSRVTESLHLTVVTTCTHSPFSGDRNNSNCLVVRVPLKKNMKAKRRLSREKSSSDVFFKENRAFPFGASFLGRLIYYLSPVVVNGALGRNSPRKVWALGRI